MSNPKAKKVFFQRILFCTDFSENAEFAFDYALDVAQRRPGSTLFLLHVIPEPDAQFWRTYLYEVEDIDSKARADMEQRIRESYLERVPEGIQVKVEIRVGKDYAQILDFAKENDIELIIMGRQGDSNWSTVLFGNVTEKVARHADCAVLIIPLSFEKKAPVESE